MWYEAYDLGDLVLVSVCGFRRIGIVCGFEDDRMRVCLGFNPVGTHRVFSVGSQDCSRFSRAGLVEDAGESFSEFDIRPRNEKLVIGADG